MMAKETLKSDRIATVRGVSRGDGVASRGGVFCSPCDQLPAES